MVLAEEAGWCAGGFVLKKNGGVCTTNDGFCVKNDRFCTHKCEGQSRRGIKGKRGTCNGRSGSSKKR